MKLPWCSFSFHDAQKQFMELIFKDLGLVCNCKSAGIDSCPIHGNSKEARSVRMEALDKLDDRKKNVHV